MSICFVHLENLFAIPYLHKYTDQLTDDYDIIYWDRRGLNEQCGASRHYKMSYIIGDNAKNRAKMIGYLKFRSFCIGILKNNHYDCVICLTSTCAVLIGNYLQRNYKGRYIIDIRDYSYEKYKLYFIREDKMIRFARTAVISSPAYKKFLPDNEYLICHNIPQISKEQLFRFQIERNEYIKENLSTRPLNITYIGGIRFLEQDKRILDFFSNDARFIIRYFGSGSEVLLDYCSEKQINNVRFLGRFAPSETLGLYKDVDIIMNLYGNGTPLLDYALSNKLYYAALLNIPILVSPKTYMSEIANRYGLGFDMSLDNIEEKNRLLMWYYAINREEMKRGTEKFINEVITENKAFETAIKNIGYKR